MARTRTYDYQLPSYDKTVDRAERKGSLFDSLFKDVKTYRSKQGQNVLRILPPGWPNAAHYGLTVFIHRDVGPNDRQYLCLKENPSSPHSRCPICEELYRLGAKATQEDRQLLRAKPNVVYYVIDRDNEKDGVQVWVTSPTTDSEIAAQSINRRTKSVIDIVHPDEGYDLEFTRTGTSKTNTRYRGFQVMREPSPLHDNDRKQDEWLDVAFDRPLPSLLQFYSPEHIEGVFYGVSTEKNTNEEQPRSRLRDAESDDEDEDNRPAPRRTRPVDDEPAQARPARRRATTDDDDNAESNTNASRGRSRDVRDDAIDDARNDNRPSARTRRAAAADDSDTPMTRPPRSRLAEDLDDEIPESHRARPNGRTRNAEPDDQDEDDRPAPRRRRQAVDDESDPDAGTGADERRRERMRERLNRE